MELTLDERLIIEDMISQFYTQKEIAKCIGKSQQCISKELKRYAYKGVYRAKHADFLRNKRKKIDQLPIQKLVIG